MARVLKIVILIWPLVIVGCLFYLNYIEKTKLDKHFINADGLVWGKGGNQIRVSITEIVHGEQQTFEILFIGKNDNIVKRSEFTIDWDMYGGGFIKGVQADDDSDYEILVWGQHEWQRSYLLDYSEGQVNKISYQEAPIKIKEIPKLWNQATHGTPMLIFLSFPLFFGYYIIVGIIWLIIYFRRKHTNR
jgi:hypothetical protein